MGERDHSSFSYESVNLYNLPRDNFLYLSESQMHMPLAQQAILSF